MTTATAYSLRPLERNTPHTALEGGFRVHLAPKELKSLGVLNGEPIRLSTSAGPKGFAVAWNATPTNAGNKPIAKVTDLLRETYGLSLEERVFITKTSDSWRPIESIKISLVLPSDGSRYESTEELLHWARYALGGVSLISTLSQNRFLTCFLSGSGLDPSWMHVRCTTERSNASP